MRSRLLWLAIGLTLAALLPAHALQLAGVAWAIVAMRIVIRFLSDRYSAAAESRE